MLKKVDKLLLSSFIGPFIVSFGIALFVLIMQFLWLYIDEIAGKGVSIFIMAELIGYLSVATFPMALPIAVLVASVMVFGNMAERYELSSFKSAGVSLLRVMYSLIFAAACVGVFSYICSNYLIPIANLQFKSRLYDIRKQKPALTLEEGVFNEDFRQFVIRIGDKAADGETLKDVMIEDQTGLGRVKFNQILSDSGEMFTTADKRYFVMNLYRGTQYQEPQPTSNGKKQGYPFIRTNFKSWTKVWDLKEFEMNSTDKGRFASQRTMLTMKQLKETVDSLGKVMDDTRSAIADDVLANLKRNLVKTKASPIQTPANIQAKTDSTSKTTSIVQAALDKERAAAASSTANKRTTPTTANKSPKPKTKKPTVPPKKPSAPAPPKPAPPVKPTIAKQILDKPLKEYASFEETILPEDRPAMLNEALNKVRGGLTMIESRKNNIESRRKESVKTAYELYSKYSFALICFVFLFIGAPMGAIIRKGGFGYPLLVSIIFFVTFIVLTITCRKLAETYLLTPFWAAMTPCIILMVVGFVLTRKAMNDSQMINTDRFEQFLAFLQKIFKKRKTVKGSD